MLEPKKLQVNGNEYTLTPFNPVEAFDFCYDYVAAEGRGESLAPFKRRAINQCLDPMMRPLRETANFQKCFSDHPEDMLSLANMALNELVGPFVRSGSDTGKTATA